MNSLEVHKEFHGMYQLPSINAATLTEATLDALCRMNLPLSKLRGQCYNGASSMKGGDLVLPNESLIRSLKPSIHIVTVTRLTLR